MESREAIEIRIRRQVENELALAESEAARQAEWEALHKRKRAASVAAMQVYLAPLAALEAKATTLYQVLAWDCEGRYSHPVGIFSTKEEADKVAATTGPMGTPSESVPSLVWDNAQDYKAFNKLMREKAQAETAAYERTR